MVDKLTPVSSIELGDSKSCLGKAHTDIGTWAN